MEDKNRFFELSLDILAIAGFDGHIKDLAPAIEKTLGYKISELLGKPFIEMVHPEDRVATLIEMQKLNTGSNVINFESRYRCKDGSYKWLSWSCTSVVSQGLIYAFGRDTTLLKQMVNELQMEINERKRTEEAIKERLKYEKLLNRISSKAINAVSRDGFLDESLKEMGENLGISRSYIFEHDKGAGTLTNTFEWVGEGITPQKDNLQNIPVSTVPWWMERMWRNETINYADIEDIPRAAETESLRRQDAKSILVVPLYNSSGFFGFIGFDECIRHRKWLQEDVDILRSVSQIISGAMERNRAEEVLRESEYKYRSLFEHMLNGCAYHKVLFNEQNRPVDYIFLEVNDAFEKQTGLKRQDVVGRRVTEVIPGIQTSGFDWISVYGKVASTGESVKFDQHFEPLNRWFSVSAFCPMRGYFVTAFTDITEEKRWEESLRESEERYRSLVETSPDAIVLTDLESGVLMCNQRAADLYGAESSREMIGRNAFNFIAPEDRKRAADNALKALQEGSIRVNEYTLVRENGARFPVEISVSSIVDAEGNPRNFVAAVRDITERKRMEEKLNYISNAVENASDGICVADATGIPIYRNKALVHLFEYTIEELDAAKDPSMVYCDPEVASEVFDTIKSGNSWRGEVEMRTRSGRVVPVLLRADAIEDKTGKVVGLVGIHTDITERKQAQEEIRQSFERMQRTFEGTVQAMALIVEMRDPYTAGHEHRAAELVCAIAKEMGFSKEQSTAIRLAAIVHDIGKISIPAETLSKPGRISQLEFSLIKIHCQVGYDILRTIEFPWPIAQIVFQHHERMDGSGYPSGLKGEEILLEARILAVADVVEAMASHRPYRPALGIDTALQEISDNSGILYEPAVVNACLKVFREKGFRFEQKMEGAVPLTSSFN